MVADAWLVGSALTKDNPPDWDIVVPYNQWYRAAFLIPEDARPNKFGGWRFQVDGTQIDMWPGDVAFNIAHSSRCDRALHIQSGILVQKTAP